MAVSQLCGTCGGIPRSLCLLLLLLSACWCLAGGTAFAKERSSFAYTARVLLREGERPARPVGGVSAVDGRVRLDVDLGTPGVFHVLLRPDERNLYVVSDNLRAYVSIPLREGIHGLDTLAEDVAASVMPFGVPVLTLRVERGESLGAADWQGYAVERTAARFSTDFMGNATTTNVVLWENPDFSPLPLRVEEVRKTKDGSVRPKDVVELADIAAASFSAATRAELFEPPVGFTRYASLLDLLLYALAAS